MASENVLKAMQVIVTDLSQQADGHQLEALLLGSEGYTKLQQKYEGHAAEERGYVGKIAARMLDLGCEVKLQEKKAGPLYKDPIEWLKYDNKVSVDGLAWLKGVVEEARDDYTTYDILKEYYQDEEEDLYWDELQFDLIERLGEQNWLLQQLDS